MVNMKIDLKGSGVDVNKTSGFEPYEGKLPTPGIYAAVIRSIKVRVSQAGNPYFNVMYELADQVKPEKQEFKGAPIWDRVVPGESDVQKERVGKLLHVISGKDPSKVNVAIDHEEVTNGGKVNKIGGKEPVGTKVRLTVRRGSNNGEPEAEVQDVFPWPKDQEWPDGSAEPETDEDEEIEEEEPEESETEEPEDEAEEDSEEEEEDEESDEEEEEEEVDDEAIEERRAELTALSRVEIKKALKSLDSEFKVLKSHSDEDLVEAIINLEFPLDDGEEPPF